MGLDVSKYVAEPRFLSEAASEILDLFRIQHRRPGARMNLTTVEGLLKTKEPTVVAAVSELTRRQYVLAPDADTIELTALGFDAIQLANYRKPADSLDQRM
jgi:Mn-dependent DtxR family transcriptional regulator